MENEIANALLLDELLSSSSSSEDEEDEIGLQIYDEIFGENRDHYRLRIPRVENFIETVIVRYNNVDFQENFRLSRDTFEYVLYLIRPNLEGQQDDTNIIAADKQLYITLFVLGSPDSYRSVCTKFDVGKATAWRAVKRVVRAICELRNIFIRWPSEIEAQETAARILRTKGFPGVIGAVDATHIRISAPQNDPQSYINRKGFHSLQLQAVCNDKLEFIHCYTGLPGSVHDARVFRYSGLPQRFNEGYFPRNTHLLGDSAYPLNNNLIVPYVRNRHLTIEEEYFNTKLPKVRSMIERAFGILKGRWRYFLDKLPMRRTDLIPYYILCACVLHNICLKREDELEYPVVIPEIGDENVGPVQVNHELEEQGIHKRMDLTRIINANINN